MNDEMNKPDADVNDQLALMARRFHEQRTGHAPGSVSAVLCKDTLVLTLNEALTKAEQELAHTPEGAAKVQEFHRQLFSVLVDEMKQEIWQLTGRRVREATLEVMSPTGVKTHSFVNGDVVQIFQLTQKNLPDSARDENPLTDNGQTH